MDVVSERWEVLVIDDLGHVIKRRYVAAHNEKAAIETVVKLDDGTEWKRWCFTASRVWHVRL